MAPASSSLVKPPTSPVGYVDEGRFYALAVDFAETIGDLIWPASVTTFSAMRNDPALNAVLSAYTLPIRRATWAVDPAGCRPEVAQLVADDLGLPIVGDDTPGAARTRGVSWSEHLRAALMHLVYGHAGFELLADVSSGQARLVGLYERVQHTIAFIHSTPTGDFGGISQLYHPGTLEQAEIGPERMVWYSHDRQGSAWHGRSVIRAAYAPWLLKREMQRVLATSSRRFGMGVPTVRALPGTSPSPGQMEAAAQVAQSMRGGETAGAAIPPNFVVELQGITGSVPDTLAFIKWLDQQMSKMALAQFLDLGGESAHGSRALGQSFIDLFTLSLAAIAESVADTVTRQAAARIVEWNWGENEPVPRVAVTDVGTKHEITADALLQLMQAGAIGSDPALEAYVRNAYQLPARSTPWTPPNTGGAGGGATAGTATVDAGVQAPTPVAAAAPRRPARRRKQPEGQLALLIAAATGDSLQTEAEAYQVDWESAKADLLAQWPDLAQPIAEDLAQQASEAAGADDLVALAALVVPPAIVAGVTAALTAAMLGLAGSAAELAIASASAQGVKDAAVPTAAGAARVGQVAQATAQLIATRYATSAATKAMTLAGPNADPQAVLDAVKAHLDELATSGAGMVADAVGAALSAAQTAGRHAVFEKYPPKRLIAVEHNDDGNRCQPCSDINNEVFPTLAEAEAAYAVSGYVGCLGGSRCRGHLRAEWT